MWWLAVAWGCGGDREYALVGEVVEARPPDRVVVAHEAIPGFMDAMTMPFEVASPAELSGVDPGDRIAATLVVDSDRSVLRDLRVTEEAPATEASEEAPPELPPGASVPEGTLFPSTPVRLAQGSPVTVGQGQSGRWAVTFIYTRCPIPEYCPLVVSRFQALQRALPKGARLLAITMDPEHDTRAVLQAFGDEAGAVPGRWDFGVVPDEVLFGLAEKAGLKVTGKGLGIVHDLVLLILDEDGRLVKRYHDMSWDQDEVLALLAAP
jgi:protein SCO1/2